MGEVTVPGEEDGTRSAGKDPGPVLDPELKARIDKMAADFMPQVRAEAWKVYQRAPHALELDELEALGLLGMTQAVSAWGEYCRRRGFDPQRTEYLIAYILRRVRGAMLDALRSQDWVTRSARTRAKLLRSSGQDLGLGEQELARNSGLSVTEVRQTIAAVAARPVSMDAEPYDVPDQSSTESQAVVSSVLAAAAEALRAQPLNAQLAVMLRFFYGLPAAEAAAVLGVSGEEAARLSQDAILAVHSALVRAVSLGV